MSADAPECPLCGESASSVSWQTADGQEVCGNKECPINTWDADIRWIEFECMDCGEHISRPERGVDLPGLTPKRCTSCTLEAMLP